MAVDAPNATGGSLPGRDIALDGNDSAPGIKGALCSALHPDGSALVNPAFACGTEQDRDGIVPPGFEGFRPGSKQLLPDILFGPPDEAPEAANNSLPSTGYAQSSPEPLQGSTAKLPEASLAHADPGDAEADPAEHLVGEPAVSLSRGGLTLSAGYSSVERFRVSAQLQRNFPESGRQISANLGYSSLRFHGSLGFSADRFIGRKTAFSASVFASRHRALGFTDRYRASPFEQRSAGIETVIRHAVSRDLAVASNLRLSREEFRLTGNNPACDAALYTNIVCREVGRTNQAELTVSLALDRRNHPVQPTRGFRFRLAESLVARQGAVQYLKSEAAIERHVQHGEEWSVATTVQGGAITKIGKKGAPIFDRFYLGGQNLRGFDLRGVGPRVTASAPTGIRASTGGSYFYSARVELVGHVSGYLGRNRFRPSLFVEAGSAFAVDRNRILPNETLSGNHAAPRVSIGMGVRLPTPVGSIRMDFSLPVISRKGDRKQVFSLSVGV